MLMGLTLPFYAVHASTVPFGTLDILAALVKIRPRQPQDKTRKDKTMTRQDDDLDKTMTRQDNDNGNGNDKPRQNNDKSRQDTDRTLTGQDDDRTRQDKTRQQTTTIQGNRQPYDKTRQRKTAQDNVRQHKRTEDNTRQHQVIVNSSLSLSVYLSVCPHL
jgi:hypothetical protein